MVKNIFFNKIKIFKSLLFFSFVFNVLVANGYSYMIFSQVANQLYNTTTIFKLDNRHIVLAQKVGKDVKDMFDVTTNMLNIVGFVDSLFNTSDKDFLNSERRLEIKIDDMKNLIFSMVDCFYIFSLSDLIVNLKINDGIDFGSNNTEDKFLEFNKNLNNVNYKKDIYDLIKRFFIVQNIENHSKIFLNVLTNLNVIRM